MPKIDAKLYEFATVRQLELLEAISNNSRSVMLASFPNPHKFSTQPVQADVRPPLDYFG